MTNMRAYRDGKRLVIVIEDPTKDLESLVAAMLTGEIKSVKDLDEPKKMARPEIDLKKMKEVKQPEAKDMPRKAAFVKKLEEETAKIHEERTENVPEECVNPSEVKEVREETESEEKAPVETGMEHVDEPAERVVAPIDAKAETMESTPVHEEPEEISEKADIHVNTEVAISECAMQNSTHTMPETNIISEAHTMQENAHHERAALREPPIESVIRFIQARSKTPKTLNILRKEYKTTDVNVVLKKLDERAIREFARSIR